MLQVFYKTINHYLQDNVPNRNAQNYYQLHNESTTPILMLEHHNSKILFYQKLLMIGITWTMIRQ